MTYNEIGGYTPCKIYGTNSGVVKVFLSSRLSTFIVFTLNWGDSFRGATMIQSTSAPQVSYIPLGGANIFSVGAMDTSTNSFNVVDTLQNAGGSMYIVDLIGSIVRIQNA